MESYEYSVIEVGRHWQVRAPDREDPLATYDLRTSAWMYAVEAARQKADLDGVPTGVRPNVAT